MARATALAVAMMVLAGVAPVRGDDATLQVFKTQRDIEKRLMAADLATLERVQDQIRAACDRLVRLGDDLLRAQKDGEDLGAYTARSSDLRHAESELNALLGAAAQLRATIGARRAYLDQVQAEIHRMEEASAAIGDELSGRWSVVIDPGGLTGVFDLHLDGTVVTGVYQLSGGWRGSLRGTLIGGDLRLERIDTQQGFVAVYSGALVTSGNQKQLQGTWEATNLAAGMPGSGTWLGRREAQP